MKRLFSLFAIVTMLFVTSCQYDDSALTDRVDNLENRVEVLEALCAQLNTNISSLQTIVSALQSKNFITSVEPILKDGKTTGWKISFTNGDPITIYNGVDGVDGKTPVIGVKKASDDIYYWTIDGEWLYDTDGNKVQAQATDGADGDDGVTPKFQINNKGYWEVSYDNGSTWTEIGKATGADGSSSDAIFSGVDEDDEYVYFTLADGSTITVPKQSSLSITFDEEDLAEVKVNSEVLIGYTVSSVTKSVDIEVTSSADLKAAVVANDATNLTGYIKVVTGNTIDEYSKVIVFVSNDEKVIMKSIVFEPQQGGSSANIQIINGATKSVSKDGGQVTLEFLAGVECEVVIPDAAKSWISVVDTRALQEHSITLDIKANTGATRSANVTVQSLDGKESVKYTITQPGTGSSEPITGEPAPNEIWYTSSTNEKVELFSTTGFSEINIKLLSNTYANGKGVLKFDGAVTKVADNAFKNRDAFTSITLPSGITTIGANAFNYCRGLTELTLPEGVNKISYSAFYTCSNLTTINIPESVTEIGSAAFYGCTNLRSIKIPKNVKAINTSTFQNCTYLKDIEIAEGVTTIGTSAFERCAELAEITIPSTITTIGENAFSGTALKYITLPENITAIAPRTFKYCFGLKGVKFSKNITSIGEEAFSYCESLIGVIIPEGVTTINYNTFYNCTGLSTIDMPNTVTKISVGAFQNCSNLEEIILSNSLETINTSAFTGCSKLKSIEIPQSVTVINSNAFNQCASLANFSGKFATEDNLSLVVNKSLIAFAIGANIEEYTIPTTAINIAEEAFAGCKSLTKVTIHPNVVKLIDRCFANCDNLKDIYCQSTTPPTAGEDIFDGISPEAIIHVPAKCGEAYVAAWSSYADMIQEEPSDEPEVTVENNKIFYTTTDGKVIDVSEINFGVNEVSNSYTEGKGVIEFDGDVTIIPKNTFAECANLATITLPNTVTSIERSAFSGCSNLTSITLSNTLESIGERCFSGCSSLTTINIPESVETIGQFVCEGCPSLSSFTGKFASADGACLVVDGKLIAYATDYNAIYTIPSTVSTIGKNVFKDNSVLTSITIPESVETIESMAFLGCSNLSSIICQNATKAPKGADGMFDDIADDAKIYVPATAVNMYKEAWQSYVETDNIVAQE